MKKKTALGKLVAFRAYTLQWMVQLGQDGAVWKYDDVLELGHRITQINFIAPTNIVVKKKVSNNRRIGGKLRVLRLMKRAGDQLCTLPTFDISKASEFDDIFHVLSKFYPTLVNYDKPLLISKLTTLDAKDNVFKWERADIGVIGAKEWRLILMSVNGYDVTTMGRAKQLTVCGTIAEDLCAIHEAIATKPACKLAISA